MELLKGKPVADKIKEQVGKLAEAMLDEGKIATLGILRIGENESDIAYENSAAKVANTLGIAVEKYIMDARSTEEDVLDVLKVMNEEKIEDSKRS